MSADLVLMCEPTPSGSRISMGKGTLCRGNFRLVIAGRCDARCGLWSLRARLHFLFPGTGLPLEQVHSYFDSLRLSGIDHPYDLAASFLVADLDSDHVSRLQLGFQAGELGPVMADVPGLGMVAGRDDRPFPCQTLGSATLPSAGALVFLTCGLSPTAMPKKAQQTASI